VLKKIIITTVLSLGLHTSFASSNEVENPWFVGGVLGYGSTTWNGLVPNASAQSDALKLSTPIEVREGGFIWGVSGGVEAIKNFQLQLEYLDFPDANVKFDEFSLYADENNNETEFNSKTHVWSIQGKFLVPWQDSNLRIFASGGPAWMSRRDNLYENDLWTPTFGIGLNYIVNKYSMVDVAFSYTAGNGQSELNPSAHYMPFLYGVLVRLYIRLG
jgi:hypothetical protein